MVFFLPWSCEVVPDAAAPAACGGRGPHFLLLFLFVLLVLLPLVLLARPGLDQLLDGLAQLEAVPGRGLGGHWTPDPGGERSETTLQVELVYGDLQRRFHVNDEMFRSATSLSSTTEAATTTAAAATKTTKENVHIVAQISDLVGKLFEGAVVCPAAARVPDDLTLSWMASLLRATSSSSSCSSTLSLDTNEAGTNRGRLVPPTTAEWKRLRVRPGVGCLTRWTGVAGLVTAGAAVVVVVVVVEVEELEGANLKKIYLDIFLCFFREIIFFCPYLFLVGKNSFFLCLILTLMLFFLPSSSWAGGASVAAVALAAGGSLTPAFFELILCRMSSSGWAASASSARSLSSWSEVAMFWIRRSLWPWGKRKGNYFKKTSIYLQRFLLGIRPPTKNTRSKNKWAAKQHYIKRKSKR